MKVLHVTSSLEIGGAQRVRLELLRQLFALGHEPKDHLLLYFHDGPMREKFENLGVKTINLSGKFLTYGFGAFKKMRQIFCDFAPDIIHSQLWAANFFVRFAAAGSRIPVICDLHSMPEVHGFWRNFIENFAPKPLCYVAVSEGIANSFSAKFALTRSNIAAVKDGSLVVIKNGVDAHKFKFSFAARENLRELFEIDSDCFVIGAVGRLEAVKSFEKLIHAFAEFHAQVKAKITGDGFNVDPQVRLIIVGDGSEKVALKALAKSYHLGKKITITKPTRSISRFYSLFDCFAVSSRSEGLSVALLEALFSGLKVVTTTQFNQHEVIENGKNGILIPFNDKSAMVRAFLRLYEEFNPEFLERPSLACQEFEIENMSGKYQELYKTILHSVKASGQR